jgi:beta-lactamase regulating signal transducer with metallopeptidase domain
VIAIFFTPQIWAGPLQAWVTSPHAWVERLGWTLLHFLWQGVLIAKLFAAARALRGASLSSRTRYGMACASLAAMALAPLVTYWSIGAGNGLMPADPSGWSARPFAVAYSSAARVAADGWHLNLPEISRQVLPWIVTAWLFGALVFSIRLAGGWAVAARLREAGKAHPAPPEWQEKLADLMVRMRHSRPVCLLISPLAQAPAVAGWLRPAILMPVGALTGLPAEQIEALLAHELAHIRRHDYLINLLQSMAEALLFYHPSVWWISNEIRAERELCCDDAAVAACGDALIYARALATVESERPARLRTVMAANGGSLANRIRRLLEPSQSMSHMEAGPGAAAALSIVLLAGIGAAAVERSSVPAPVLPLPRVAEASRTAALPGQQETRAVAVTRRAPASKARAEEPASPSPRLAEEAAPESQAVKSNLDEAARHESANLELRNQAAAESERRAAWESEASKRNIEESAARYRFGNSEARGWAAVEGEPMLRAIEFRGMTEEFAGEVLARLPIREGQRISHAARERIGDVIREYGRRLEFGLFRDGDDGAVLRIHPPGSANREPLRREEKERK